MIVFGFLYSL